MKKFKEITYTKPTNPNPSIGVLDYISAMSDLKNAIINEDHRMYSIIGKGSGSSEIIREYYDNAIRIGTENDFLSADLSKKINESISTKEGEISFDMLVEDIDSVITELNTLNEKMNEDSPVADTGSVNGMGAVQLPSVDGVLGSGDFIANSNKIDKEPEGATAEDKETKKVQEKKAKRPIKMNKFKAVKETREVNEKEVYIPITDLGDPAKLLDVIASELTARDKSIYSKVVQELTDIEISYNGVVDKRTLVTVSNTLGFDIDKTKKKIDYIVDKNIELLENLQADFMRTLLLNPKSLNEGIIGRALGAIGGFALGPKVGKLIAKVLGITKGPLYNVLTSRVVSAALAQELTKNLL